MIVYVAEHLHKSWAALRRALDIDAMELEELPTDHERAVAAEGQVTELQAELSVAKEALRKAGDAKRKAAERAAKKREKREEAKAAKAAKVKQQKKQQKQQLKAAVAAKVAKAIPAMEKRLEEEA